MAVSLAPALTPWTVVLSTNLTVCSVPSLVLTTIVLVAESSLVMVPWTALTTSSAAQANALTSRRARDARTIFFIVQSPLRRLEILMLGPEMSSSILISSAFHGQSWAAARIARANALGP